MATPRSRLVIDLKDASSETKAVFFTVPSKPFVSASWTCTYSQTGVSPNYSFKAQVKWTYYQPGLSSTPDIVLLTGTGAGAVACQATPPSPFPSSGAVELTKSWNESSYLYKNTFKLEIGFQLEHIEVGAVDPYAAELVLALTATIDTRQPHDVRIEFSDGRELWANSKILASASPYFKSLLESGFAESSLVTSKETSSEVTTSPNKAGDDSESSWDGTEDDSDEETDTLVAKDNSKSTQNGSYHNIKSPATITTYRAVLVYLLSHHISFAPLLSTFRASTYPAAAEATPSRHQAVRVLASKNTGLPSPASPKSVYRLAHLLQLPTLEDLALKEIQKQLSVDNVAYELYGNVAGLYDGVREIVLDFCVENWAAVCETSAMKEMEQLAEAGELSPKVIATAMQLAKRLKK